MAPIAPGAPNVPIEAANRTRSDRRKDASSLAAEQRGVIARRQLEELEWSSSAIGRALRDHVLRPVWPGVYGYGHCVLTRDEMARRSGAGGR